MPPGPCPVGGDVWPIGACRWVGRFAVRLLPVGGGGCPVLRRGMLGLSLRSSYVRAPPASGPATLTPAETTPGLGPPRKGDA
ncbi:hypothetical protein GCM10010273_47990 [Streptomyces lavendulocolor]